MAPKLRLRLASTSDSAPRNSFTQTDYYRTTREEYYSPLPRVESPMPISPTSPYAYGPGYHPHYSTKRLAQIDEGSNRDLNGGNKFWHVFDAFWRKWRRQKEKKSKQRHHPRF